MITALMLIFDPFPTWERIVLAQRRPSIVLARFLVPLLLLAATAEGFGLAKWGKPRGSVSRLYVFPVGQAVLFEIVQLGLSLLVVCLGAQLIKALGDTFHGRHTFAQAFTVAAFGLSPLFACRVLNMFAPISPWATWIVGIVLSAAVLYNGLPKVMEPDPPHAFGLYLMSVLLLLMITGLACFVTTGYLQGKFPGVDAIFMKPTQS